MNSIRKVVAVALVAGAAALPLSSAQAWWGGPWNNGGWGPFSNNGWGPFNNGGWGGGPWNTMTQWGPFNGLGNGAGDAEFNLRMHVNARAMMDSATNGMYSTGPWAGIAPWTHSYRPYMSAPIMPMAPAPAPEASAAAQ
ncbi:MAG: hypothetical protein H6981_08830 [Gammaproteobacteria bacterium]|nr:hypothetical protein [Gammaproteobacteria bacterium]MCP5136892.1 hypothetical protein [Gammaproteobacteria bacterium]